MLDHLRQIAIFAKTVDHGSFRAAAQALHLSPSVVSHHITQLETHLGVALLYRSTRRLSLTRDGERLIVAARDMLDAAESGLQAVSDQAAQPSGELHVTIPAALARSHVVDRIAQFTATYPAVRLTLDFSDLRREVIAGGIDVALRMGWLEDSSLKARKLFDVERYLIAAQSYIDQRPPPVAPNDLQDWDWLALTQVGLTTEFRAETQPAVTLKPKPRLSANDAHALYHLARSGAGLALIPEYLARDDIAAGLVRHILPEWNIPWLGSMRSGLPMPPKRACRPCSSAFSPRNRQRRPAMIPPDHRKAQPAFARNKGQIGISPCQARWT